ncbi:MULTISPECIES: sensor histidine kinase [unclassified Streptomyces]|uniref:sensor histidine kinase n=1 Tax=unclassified Streptomyces TaxID=2593676 RepID=UPI002E2D75AF|nr:ATP-binding protein [Streptomyces sp. NBC_00223]
MRAAATHARLTIRTRLTLTYGGLFAASAAAMIGLLYLFMMYGPSYSPTLTSTISVTKCGAALCGADSHASGAGAFAKPTSPGLLAFEVSSKADFLQALVLFSAVALLVLMVIVLLVGWVVAGRMLAPLQKITSTAQGIADSTLHERIPLDGPRDEIRELAETFNAMLRRLEQAFQAQRRFAANASHELRTPLASMRTILQVTLAVPDPEQLRIAGPQLLALNQRSTEITEALLTLARADHGAIAHEEADLGSLAHELWVQSRPQAEQAGVTVAEPRGRSTVWGDSVLLRQLMRNLVDNAIRHNHRGGTVTVGVAETDSGEASIRVRNTGPELGQDEVDRAFEPFHRLDTRKESRTARPGGHGLGLAIVQSIVRAHDGTLTATPLRPNGLEVTVRLPGPHHRVDAEPHSPAADAGHR